MDRQSERVAEFTRRRNNRNKLYRLIAVMGLLVVAFTAFMLIRPAITMEGQAKILNCQYTVHQHDDSCYKENADGEKELVCGKADYVIHEHEESCYDSSGRLICPLNAVSPEEAELHTHTEDCYDESGDLTCGKPEVLAHTHGDECFETASGDMTAKSAGNTDGDENSADTEDKEEAVSENTDPDSIAEPAVGDNWKELEDSGWFEEYSDDNSSSVKSAKSRTFSARSASLSVDEDGSDDTSTQSSDEQVVDKGGTNTSEDGAVSVSKTISGTDLENVFDITLQVQTSQNISEITEEPDMAVVIVMDISNTMNSNFGGVTRYAAAMTAAEEFLDEFVKNNSKGISKVGYVAFNTDAHQIFGLQSCSAKEQADALKNTMRTQTGSIINADGYKDAHSRFTNVEAGLAMASDMLNGVTNKNKYIIFLSDGFPTTYISSGYSGYDPYDSTGRFHDRVLNKPCTYGTSYSDEAAIRARNKAEEIKNSDTTIFSIGVDVAGQTIQKYITQSESASGYSVVDRTGTTYEIGDASSTEAYKNWLKNSIGSGYYYDSTDSAGLSSAYDNIFEVIRQSNGIAAEADWVTSDPIPTVNGSAENVEFIGFYNKTPALVEGDLTGNHIENGENTAGFNVEENAISWDLKKSGYLCKTDGTTTTYTYQLVYRVRLKNENNGFIEGTVYPTNDTTTLQYRNIYSIDGNVTVSEVKKVEFPIPSVKGYLSEFSFKKVNYKDELLSGAEFTLSHDTANCSICRGNGEAVTVTDLTATSDSSGNVTFTGIPSGHKYTMKETKAPDGYSVDPNKYYSIEIAYDELSVTVTDGNGKELDWNNEVVNGAYYALPETGGIGTLPFTIAGIILILGAGAILYRTRLRRRED
ncbi:MAG: SpaA isopeptide-forming pilin-related protein [Lentihominibacter sp.]